MAWWGSIPSDGGSATRPIVLFSDGVVPACPYLGGGGWRSSNACGYKMRESSTLYSQPMIGIPQKTTSRRPHPITEDMTRLVESSWGMVALTRCLPKHTRRHCSPTPRCETRLQTWKSQDTHARDAPSQGNRVTGTHMRGLHNQPAPSDLHRDPNPPPHLQACTHHMQSFGWISLSEGALGSVGQCHSLHAGPDPPHPRSTRRHLHTRHPQTRTHGLAGPSARDSAGSTPLRSTGRAANTDGRNYGHTGACSTPPQDSSGPPPLRWHYQW